MINIAYPDGATILDPDEMVGLLPDYITTHAELNELEHINIQHAHLWLSKQKDIDPLDILFIYTLHKMMFGKVWKWAGKNRMSGKNIGIDWNQIPAQLHTLIGDTKFWIENKSYRFDEIAVRFHHRLVSIHVFPNGNGRHGRLLTDLLLKVNNNEIFSWGKGMSVSEIARQTYIAALKEADKYNYMPLIKFARS